MFGRGKKESKRRLNQRRGPSRGQLLQVSGRSADKGRGQAHKAGALLLLLAALGALVWMLVAGTEWLGRVLFSENPRFTIRVLDLQSNGRLRPEQLREYGKVAEGQNLFAVNIAQVRANLETAPLIRTAEIKRDLPDTLIIRVRERTALARLAGGAGGYPMLVDRDGYILGLAGASTLPLLTGASERGLAPGSVVREKQVLDALDALDLCDTTKLGSVIHVQTVDVRNPDALVLGLSGGEVINLGRSQLTERLEKLSEVLKTAQELGKVVKSADITVLRNVPVVYRTP